ncbi:MAG TPA: hypothetical protein PKH77_00540 [Anaerolineae bacterium]|nr:hypothetical protein [Anaerolineae bacterium]
MSRSSPPTHRRKAAAAPGAYCQGELWPGLLRPRPAHKPRPIRDRRRRVLPLARSPADIPPYEQGRLWAE